MFLECQGDLHVRPTVVLDAWSSDAVAALVRAVSDITSVCTYDHAGTRRSDPAPELPRSSRAYADDLHELLAGAGVGGPYVFVPWSANSWTTILSALTYPEDLAGIVMIDPRGPSVSDKHLEALPSPSPDEPEAVTGARDFLLEPITNPGENDDEGMDAREALDAEGLLFGDLPVIILSGADTKEEWLSDLTPELRDEFWNIWLDDQKRLAAESTRGEWRVVEGSAHEIHRAQLQAVVDAIDEVVDQAK